MLLPVLLHVPLFPLLIILVLVLVFVLVWFAGTPFAPFIYGA